MSTQAATATQRPATRRRFTPNTARFSGFYVWAAFIVLYAFWVPDTFLRTETAQSIISTQAVSGLAALGLICAILVGALDLSFAATLGLSSTVAASLMARSDVSPVLTIIICVALGVGIGTLNGLLVARAGISSIVVTLGTSSLIGAANEKVGHSEFIPGVPSSFTDLTSGKVLGIPTSGIYLLAFALVVWVLLEYTRTGRRMLATGSGQEAARLAGVSTSRLTFLGLVMSSTMASIAGLVALSQIGSGSPDLGGGYLLPVFAAVFLGATQIRPGRFNVWGTMLAIFLLATGVKGLQLAGGQAWVTDAFNGAALLIAVGFARFGGRRVA
jgi:ribose transport system permease protein